MTHEIINQKGFYISEVYIRDEIIHALENDKTFCYVDGSKIEIDSDKIVDNCRTTIVHIEGI